MVLKIVFEIENSALSHVLAVGNYQQTAAAKCAGHTCVVEIVIRFCPSEASLGKHLSSAGYVNFGKNAKSTCGGRTR